MQYKIYVDDVRTPTDDGWLFVCRNYNQFIDLLQHINLSDISVISLDHDLADFDTDGTEKTGFDCAVYLVNHALDNNVDLPLVWVHSSNTVGAQNIISYINNYLVFAEKEPTCRWYNTQFTVKTQK